MFWKLPETKSRTKDFKAKIQSVQCKQCSSYSELIEKYVRPSEFSHSHFPPTSSSLLEKHNIFMKTCTKQKRSRFKFKVFHCWNWNVFLQVLVFLPTKFCMENCWFLGELLDFFVISLAWNEGFGMIMDSIWKTVFLFLITRA
jgi:hypothetical protein